VRVASTHSIAHVDGRIRKTYRNWRGCEHHREWAVLGILERGAPDLSPIPPRERLDLDPPWIEMTVVPGVPLGGRLDDAQMRAMVVGSPSAA
jgi:hypothetical protein